MSYADRTPYSYIVTKSKIILSAAVDTLITRAPWPAPVGKYYKIRKVMVTNNVGSGAQLLLWDQDLSSATPAGRGSAGAALIQIPVQIASPIPVAGSGFLLTTLSGVVGNQVVRSYEQLPQEKFQAGITAQAINCLNMHVAVELEVV